MNIIACFACNQQRFQIKCETRVVYKEETVELFKKYKNIDFVSGLVWHHGWVSKKHLRLSI